MEELATVLAYRSEVLAEQEHEEQENLQPSAADVSGAPSHSSGDIEDAGGAAPPASSSSFSAVVDDTPSATKRPRIYKRRPKRTDGRPPMGPIADGKGAGGSGLLALCLSSRRNMCIHERVMAESDREAVDAACRTMTASWSTEKCPYYENFQAAGEETSMPSGVYDLEGKILKIGA